jgi:hypothetical protein
MLSGAHQEFLLDAIDKDKDIDSYFSIAPRILWFATHGCESK